MSRKAIIEKRRLGYIIRFEHGCSAEGWEDPGAVDPSRSWTLAGARRKAWRWVGHQDEFKVVETITANGTEPRAPVPGPPPRRAATFIPVGAELVEEDCQCVAPSRITRLGSGFVVCGDCRKPIVRRRAPQPHWPDPTIPGGEA